MLPDEFILFDLEFTAWEGSMQRGWTGPGEYREIVQIGAIRVGSTYQEKASFVSYVLPVRNPQLSEYFIALTGITQSVLNQRGISFEAALKEFQEFVGVTPAYCWGGDTETLEENAGLASMQLALPRNQYKNLRLILADSFAAAGIDSTQYTSGSLIQAFGHSDSLRAHDALNDMRNLLTAINALRARINT